MKSLDTTCAIYVMCNLSLITIYGLMHSAHNSLNCGTCTSVFAVLCDMNGAELC